MDILPGYISHHRAPPRHLDMIFVGTANILMLIGFLKCLKQINKTAT